ncbi:Uncharacterized protein Rs2_39691 [Raphanus sativus]|nr:hypothetical protein Rs2_49757 [Raphanus sativus]KAJ4874673.1 Uncharacterized protein Rs2_39691 [Raphanus sativus]
MKGNRNGPKPRPESTRLHQSHASTNLSQPVHVQNFIDRTCHASTIYTVINRKPRFSPEKNETTDISPEHAVDKSPRPLYRQNVCRRAIIKISSGHYQITHHAAYQINASNAIIYDQPKTPLFLRKPQSSLDDERKPKDESTLKKGIEEDEAVGREMDEKRRDRKLQSAVAIEKSARRSQSQMSYTGRTSEDTGGKSRTTSEEEGASPESDPVGYRNRKAKTFDSLSF